MEDFLMKAAQLILSLSILIVLHELGHFIPAKYFKTKVEKFYLFFDAGFSLFKFKKGETEYGIGWIPLGGYVKIAGMIDESLDKEQLSKPPEDWEFRSKPAWQRLIIMIGGVTVNIIVGFALYMMILFVWGTDYVSPGNVYNGFEASPIMEELGFRDGDQVLKINNELPESVLDVNKEILIYSAESITVQHKNGETETIKLPEGLGVELYKAGETDALSPIIPGGKLGVVIKDDPAYVGGLRENDSIITINNKKIQYWSDLTTEIKNSSKEPLRITYYREGKVDTIQVTPNDKGKIGVGPNAEVEDVYKVEHRDYGFFEAISNGFSYGGKTLYGYIAQFKFVFTSKGATEVGGFGAIGNMFGAEWNWLSFWEKTAFLSIALAFMNILPIPALDGGHVMFLIYEMIAGKPPSDKFLTNAQVVGMVLLLGLLLYANGLDIYRAIVG